MPEIHRFSARHVVTGYLWDRPICKGCCWPCLVLGNSTKDLPRAGTPGSNVAVLNSSSVRSILESRVTFQFYCFGVTQRKHTLAWSRVQAERSARRAWGERWRGSWLRFFGMLRWISHLVKEFIVTVPFLFCLLAVLLGVNGA